MSSSNCRETTSELVKVRVRVRLRLRARVRVSLALSEHRSSRLTRRSQPWWWADPTTRGAQKGGSRLVECGGHQVRVTARVRVTVTGLGLEG